MSGQPRYLRARSLAEAAAALREGGGEGMVLAGGTIVASLINQRLAAPSVIVDITRIADLTRIGEFANGDTIIGALVTHDMVLRSDVLRRRVPLLPEIARDISCMRLRNRGTLGGSLCTIGGQGDPATGLIALDAILHLEGPDGRRDLPVDAFYKDGFSLDLAEDEILKEALVPALPAGAGWAFAKEGPRNAMDWTQITVSATVTCDAGGAIDHLRIGINGAAATAVRARRAEAALRGQPPAAIDWAAVRDALDRDISPQGDLVYSADFKRHLTAVLLRRTLAAAVARTAPTGGTP